jgi:hypothetical protein
MGRTEESLAEAIREELEGQGTLVPPWVKHPNIPRYSIGWRMGSGEWYVWMWRQWSEEWDVSDREIYWTDHLPIPFFWTDWVLATFVDEDVSDVGEENVARLESLGLTVQSQEEGVASEKAKKRRPRRPSIRIP